MPKALPRPPRPHPQVYGAYYRRLSKKVQTELAEANSVAEEALSRWGLLLGWGVGCWCKSRHGLHSRPPGMVPPA